MDSLAQRYGSPFLLLDYLIENEGLADYIIDLYDIMQEEKVWEVWINKVEDKSFEEFKRKVKPIKSNETEADIKATMDYSRNIFEIMNKEDN